MKQSRRLVLVIVLVMINLLNIVSIHAEGTSTSFSGLLNDETPFLEFSVTVTQDNSNISIDIQATDGDLDTFLYLVDANGIILAENDDREDGNTDSLITLAKLSSGTYRIVATRYDIEDGDSSGHFELQVNITSPLDETIHYDVSEATLESMGYPALPDVQISDWTIFAFYGADTNLEAAIINDLDEFELAGGSNEHIRVIVLLDRSPDYTDSNGDWSDVRIFDVQQDVTGDHLTAYPPQIDSPAIAELGELNTGDGSSLAEFLVWGLRHYPANHYAVAIGSHGAGWRGLSVDETSGLELDSDYTIITIPQLKVAFDLARQTANVPKFDLLINDACLMSSVEYHTAMAPYFHVSLASPEIVVNPALDMTLLTSTLETLADGDQISDLGKQLVDKYIQTDIYEKNAGSAQYYTNAITNLDQFDPVTASIDTFAKLIIEDPTLYLDTLGRARANTYTYTAFMGENTLVDLGHFMEQVIIAAKDVKLMSAAQDILEALETARIYGNAGENAAKWSYYYNIYFPADSDDFDLRYLAESPLNSWGRMLQTYFNLSTQRVWAVADSVLVYHPPVAPKVRITQVYPAVSSLDNPPIVRMEVEGRRIARANFTVDTQLEDGSTIRLLNTPILTEIVIGNTVNMVNQWRSGVDQSEFSWLPMTLTQVTDGTTSALELLLKSSDVAILEGRYREAGSEEWHDIAVMFSLETGRVVRVINRARGTGALAEIDPGEGAEFQTYRQIVTSNGETKAIEGTIYQWNEQLSWKEVPAPAGTYQLGFLAQSFSGLAGFDSVSVEVEASADDTRGYTSLDLGLTFAYPDEWYAPFDTGSQIVTGSADGAQNIVLSYFNAEQDNPFKIAEDFALRYGLQVDGDAEILEFNGSFAAEFTYSYLLNNQIRYGHGLAFYHSTLNSGTGMVYSAESLDIESRHLLFEAQRNKLSLFDAQAVAQSDTSKWQYRFFLPGIAHPVPLDWINNEVNAEGEWTIFTPPDSTNTSAAISYFESMDETAIFEQLRAELSADTQGTLDYQNEYRHWLIEEYQRGDILGRLYVSTLGAQVFALRFETSNDENALHYIRDIFEPMVDGFAPLSNVQYALGGLDPAMLKAAMGRASLICDQINPNDACYGEGSVVVEAVIDEVETIHFATTGDTAKVPTIKELGVGISETLKNTFDSLSIAVIDAQIPNTDTQDESEAAVRMGVFGGIVISQEVQDSPVETGDQ